MTEGDSTIQGTNESLDEFSPAPPAFKDRKAGLLVFGILLLLLALASLGGAVLQFVMIFAVESPTPGFESPTAIFAYAGVFYILMTTGLAWLGIGSVRCRRWARALLHVLAAMALVSGVLSSIYMVSVFGGMAEQMRNEVGGDAAAIVPIVLGCMVVLFALLYFILPAAFFFFFRSRHVKATCEHYDPTPRWTDRYPAPMLAGGLLLGFVALIVLAPLLGMPMPFFGILLTGVPAWIYALVAGALAATLAVGFFRFDRRAWIGAIVFYALTGLNVFLSYRGTGLLEVYESMGYPQDQLDLMESMGLTRGFGMLMLLSMVVILVFYVWLGRYFGPSRDASSGESVEIPTTAGPE